MHDLPDIRARLSPSQQLRHDADTQILARTRVADLAALTPASSICMIESLRSALDDALRLIGELIDPT
ncbi:hypothetical protein ACIGBH_27275 [Streptomyces sp. NPDC085929]|uniref:hypothetical protein n=1 Tax=Streptomyces sp. NPDC085929 TaxID=3365739 RepID=UPI0037D35A9F